MNCEWWGCTDNNTSGSRVGYLYSWNMCCYQLHMYVNDNFVEFVFVLQWNLFVEKTPDLLVKQQNVCTQVLSISVFQWVPKCKDSTHSHSKSSTGASLVNNMESPVFFTRSTINYTTRKWRILLVWQFIFDHLITVLNWLFRMKIWRFSFRHLHSWTWRVCVRWLVACCSTCTCGMKISLKSLSSCVIVCV